MLPLLAASGAARHSVLPSNNQATGQKLAQFFRNHIISPTSPPFHLSPNTTFSSTTAHINSTAATQSTRAISWSGLLVGRAPKTVGRGFGFGLGANNTAATRAYGAGIGGVEPAVIQKARKIGVLIGAVAGAFGGCVGVGGGVLISPVIANACKSLPQRVISGSSLAAVATTGASAGYVFFQAGAVDVTSALVLGSCAMILGPLGARTATKMDCMKLRRLLGYWLCCIAPLVPLKAYLFSSSSPDAHSPNSSSPDTLPPKSSSPEALPPKSSHIAIMGGVTAPTLTATTANSPSSNVSLFAMRPLQMSDVTLALTGCLAGFASGLLGIGGGTVVTPLLAMCTGLPQTHVVGTSLAAMVVPSLVALGQHARLGNVDALLALGLSLGTMVGGAIGGAFAVNAPPGVLEGMFAAGMFFLGNRTLKLSRPVATKAVNVVAAAIK